jgi:FCD domain
MLETEAARLAAERRTDDDIKQLKRLLAQRGEIPASSDLTAFIDRDLAFHMGIARATHNTALEDLYRYFSASVRANIYTVLTERDLPEPDVAAHDKILTEIVAANRAGRKGGARCDQTADREAHQADQRGLDALSSRMGRRPDCAWRGGRARRSYCNAPTHLEWQRPRRPGSQSERSSALGWRCDSAYPWDGSHPLPAIQLRSRFIANSPPSCGSRTRLPARRAAEGDGCGNWH